jgi:hypothetical protein
MNSEKKWWAVAGYLAVAALALVSFAVIVSFGMKWLRDNNVFMPAIALPILLIVGVGGLLIILGGIVSVFAALNIAQPVHALGMPEGSVRAVIALSLILIFAIQAVFLYGEMIDTEIHTSIGLSEEQLGLIPSDQIIAIRARTMGESTVFEVDRRVEHSQESTDFAEQLLTTVSTLVVAVAGFYFGTKAVAEARGAVGPPTLRVLRPDSPVSLARDETLKIKVETAPKGEAVIWEVKEGDAGGTLVQIKPDEFEYAPGADAQQTVTLCFKLRKDPDAVAEVTVQLAPIETPDEPETPGGEPAAPQEGGKGPVGPALGPQLTP